ncbi:baseplate J/gp47 family protein [Dorea sp. D27]|uniref:baseplate J/gp47 family protein n=1 Tax=Dorea sp. D27 TaxID=658665 RepID=UPI0006737038|nr:baseplate J/gp47 family protein [Dorea sp. D27]KMZ53597.1 hypothetical protein HMPREF0980_02466 [Dorea sp. D27]
MLDNRTMDDICSEIKTLAASYTPEWNFSLEKPDTGSVLAYIFAEQLKTVIQEYNTLPARYEDELVRLLGIVPRKPEPARAVIVLEPSPGMQEGSLIEEGSRFYAEIRERDTPVVFESSHDVFLTDTRITAAFAISEKDRTVIPLCKEEEAPAYPISLFRFEPYIPYKNELYIRHPWLFRGELSEFSIGFGSAETAELLMDDGRFAFSLLVGGEKIPVTKKTRRGEYIVIGQGAESDTLLIERRGIPDDEFFLPSICFTAACQSAPPKYLYDGTQEITGDTAAVFGEEISLYKECYIGFDSNLIREGTEIAVDFGLVFKSCEMRDAVPKEEELKMIKRRPNPLTEEQMAEVYIQEVSLSYYNGQGFRRLQVQGSLSHIFSGPEYEGKRRIAFLCPKDWEEMEHEGYGGHLIRLQVVKADYCYHRPARHHYPYLTNMKVVYSQRETRLLPEQVVRRQGNMETDLTGYIKKKKPVPGFLKFPYRGESMLFGLDKKPAGGPVSLYVVIKKNINFSGIQTTFEYSSPKGFQPLKVLNNTEDLKNSGTILFVPPANMSPMNVEGETRYWIRLTARKSAAAEIVYPVAEHIYVNGTEVWNVERGPIKAQYAEQVVPGMSFPAPAVQLLDVKIWAKEGGRTVCYKETPSFDLSTVKDRHYVVDRARQEVVFGDGRTVRIPWNTEGAAFTMEIVSCDGEAGNVPENAIANAAFSLPNVNRIYNPLAASGGSSLETEDSVKRRGRMMLGTGGRLVSEQDYVNAAKAFSGTVANAWCEVRGRRIILAVLMQDYEAGPHSFRQIKEELTAYLLQMAPASVKKKDLLVREPIFVNVSVELWIAVEEWKRALEERSRILEGLYNLFRPVKRRGRVEPRAGYMPKESQILMAVRSFSAITRMEHAAITVSYADEHGKHTTELGRLSRSPFMVCTNGTHEVHV